MNTLWQRKDFLQAGGGVLRPGGMELTRRGLSLCAGHCGLEPSALVLDLGCGAGATLELLLAEGHRAFGLDEDIQPLLKDRPGCRGRTIRADITRLPLVDAKADALFGECVLSLLPDPAAALKEWSRVLRPGGALLLSDFYLRGPKARPPTPNARRDGPSAGGGYLHGRGRDKRFPGPDSSRLSISHGPWPIDSSPGEFPTGGAWSKDSRPDTSRPAALRPGGSCLDGALFAREWEELLREAGFLLRASEDRSADLAALAARLVWYGQGDLPQIFGLCSPGNNRSRGARQYGYGLWAAQKEAG
ncbi:MAG: class I SAM-dependent methyltransferase [Desulfovibrio sp.]|jgi:SAM-dependent methyltransferase|nr:class I SAM-dependent methyltransferase [Desulfovibrio sp.]